MCGIAGFVGRGDEQGLRRMIASIKYRGPDDQGYFCRDGIGLAQARLSIIDLSPDGHQPMFNVRGDIGMVFNGEIYNYLEVKEKLSATGKYNFISKTDTEVIIHAYDEWGEVCFEKLNGMFAIGLYDFRTKKLLLARDRMGKKPLYWGVFNNTLVFGSELKAVLKHPLAKKEINETALALYNAYDCVPTPHSIYKNIYKLEPATYLTYQSNKTIKKQFWELTFTGPQISYKEAIVELDRRINDATKSRLMADVPLGIFLSGGIDSATVAYYAQKNSPQKVKTFSIGFKEKSFDETVYAEQVAKHLGTEHYHRYVTAEDALAILPQILENMDEPFADASIIPTYLLSKFTREQVTVALGGDGGDELFAGYPTFRAESLYQILAFLPETAFHQLGALLARLPAGTGYMPKLFLTSKFLSGFDRNIFKRHSNWLSTLTNAASDEFMPTVVANLGQGGIHNRLLGMYQRTYMMDQVLVKVDRASMLNSLEVRAPFLDYTMVGFVNTLPYSYKYSGGKTKRILKDIMSDKLPINIVSRKKKGFGVPLLQWYKEGKLRDTLQPIRFQNQRQFWNQYVLNNWITRNH